MSRRTVGFRRATGISVWHSARGDFSKALICSCRSSVRRRFATAPGSRSASTLRRSVTFRTCRRATCLSELALSTNVQRRYRRNQSSIRQRSIVTRSFDALICSGGSICSTRARCRPRKRNHDENRNSHCITSSCRRVCTFSVRAGSARRDGEARVAGRAANDQERSEDPVRRPGAHSRSDGSEARAELRFRADDGAGDGPQLAGCDSRAAKAADRRIQNAAGANVFGCAYAVPRSNDRLQTAARRSECERSSGAHRGDSARAAAGANRLRYGKEGRRLEGLRCGRRRRLAGDQLPRRVHRTGSGGWHRWVDEDACNEERRRSKVTAFGPARSAPSDTFAQTDNGARWVFQGTLTMDDAARVLEDAEALPLPTQVIVDFRGLLQADSAALAVMIALK